MRIYCISDACTIFAVDFAAGTTETVDIGRWRGLRATNYRNLHAFVQNDDNTLPRIYSRDNGNIYGSSAPSNCNASDICIAARSPRGVMNNRDILMEVGMDDGWTLDERSLSFEYYTGDISILTTTRGAHGGINIYTRGRRTTYEYPANLCISSHIILGDSIYVLSSINISHIDTRTPQVFSAISNMHFEGRMRTKALSENIVAVFTIKSSNMCLSMFDRRWPTQLAAQYPPISTDWIPRSVAI